MNWIRSSYSGSGQGSNCVEVGEDLGAIRDSKNPDVEIKTNPESLRRFIKAVAESKFPTR